MFSESWTMKKQGSCKKIGAFELWPLAKDTPDTVVCLMNKSIYTGRNQATVFLRSSGDKTRAFIFCHTIRRERERSLRIIQPVARTISSGSKPREKRRK